MSLVLTDCGLTSVAKVNCPRCFGTGIWIRHEAEIEQVKYTISWCNCIKVEARSPGTPVEGK